MSGTTKQSLTLELIKNKKTKKKSDVIPLEIQKQEIKKDAKDDKKEDSPLASLNKQKVSLDDVQDKVEELKKKNKKKTIEPLDKNKDGKVSFEERLKANKKDIEPADKNRDEKVSPDEKEQFAKKTKKVLKDLVEELKKDDKNILSHKDFKNISKMVNEDVIASKESKQINSFLKD